jgi:hypothetical protein
MRTFLQKLTAFAGFAVLSMVSLFFVFCAGIDLLERWQGRSAPPRDELPPTFVERLPEVAFDLVLAAIFFYAALAWVRMTLGPSQPNGSPRD